MNRTRISVLLLTFSGLPTASFAAPVTLNYTGTVTLVDYGYVNYGYAVNDTITGFFQFDTDDVLADIFPGVYLQAGLGGPVTSNTGDGGLSANGDIGYLYAEDFGSGMVYGDVSLGDGSFLNTTEFLGGDPFRYRTTTDSFSHSIQGSGFDIFDLGGTFLDALLASPQTMTGSIYSRSFSGTYQCAPGGGFACIRDQEVTEYDYSSRVEFNLTALQVADMQTSAVPVPAAFWLFGTALIGLVGINRRKKAA